MKSNFRLNAVDLRDLAILRVLLEERHVSRAADRLGITQSAASKALSRLRDQFQDALLIRGAGGYQLSHNAKAIVPKLHTVFAQLDALYERPSEVPAEMDAEIRIAMADDIAMILLPKLLERLRTTAPAIKLTVMNTGASVLDQLRSGQIDLLMEITPVGGSGFYTHPIVKWEWCCVLPPDHPLASKELTRQRYVAADHGLVSFSGGRFGVVDEVLGRFGEERRIVLSVPYFSAVPYAAQSSQVIFTVPGPLGNEFVSRFNMVSRPVPFHIRPLDVSLIWHHRNQHDSIHRWVRQLFIEELTPALG